MLLPDQTYEQANLRQELRLRRSASAAYDDGGGFPPHGLFTLRQLDVKRLQRGLRGDTAADGHLYVDGGGVGEELTSVLANNELKFGIRASDETGEGSAGSSSGVGSSGEVGSRDEAKHPQPELDVRLNPLTNGGSKRHPLVREESATESQWSAATKTTTKAMGPMRGPSERERSKTIDGRCRSSNNQRAPPLKLKDEPSHSEQTDRGIGLDSVSSSGSSLSYSSDDSSDEGEEFTVRPQRTCQSRMNGADAAKEKSPATLADGHDPSERDDYDKTSDFFNNIPEFQGEALGPFSIESKANEPDWGNIRTNVDILRACELFLMRHRMRPDFFCKYKMAMNPSASAPASFPLSRASRTPVDVRKPKSVSPPMQRPASRAQDVSFSRASAGVPIYSVPNRAGKKRRPNAVSLRVRNYGTGM
uniref:Uncharacterized protein n=1 Tax=Anopheles farauti TaxID=69004 RepID=A0A182Q676_9DIPT